MYQNTIQVEKDKKQSIFSVSITDFGLKSLKKIVKRNQKVQVEINKMIKNLKNTPEIGRELTSDLYGMRAISSDDGEFRVVYGLDESHKQVTVHAVGHRKHIYEKLARLLQKVMPYTQGGSKNELW